MRRFAIVFPFVLLLFSCSSNYSGKTFRLRIAIDTSNNFYVRKVTLTSSNGPFQLLKEARLEEYPSLYFFDSLKAGTATFTIQSLFGRKYTQTVSLDSNTTIHVTKEQLPNYEDDKSGEILEMPFSLLDTICLATTSQGCFGGSISTTAIYKKIEGYHVIHFSNKGMDDINIERDFEPRFSILLDSLQSQWKRRKLGFFYGSTTTETFYLNVGNKVFSTSYSGPRLWNAYYNFAQHFDSNVKKAMVLDEEMNVAKHP